MQRRHYRRKIVLMPQRWHDLRVGLKERIFTGHRPPFKLHARQPSFEPLENDGGFFRRQCCCRQGNGVSYFALDRRSQHNAEIMAALRREYQHAF